MASDSISVTPAGAMSLAAVSHGHGLFVAVGDPGLAAVSANGSDWEIGTVGYGAVLTGVASGPDGWVAVGSRGEILASPDAIAWTRQSYGNTNNLLGIAHGNGLFVAVGTRGVIRTSPDARTWTTQTSGTTRLLSSVAFARGQFVAVGDGGTILASHDGRAWKAQPSPNDDYHYTVASGGGRWIAAGDGILMSRDNVVWTTAEPRVTPRMEDVVFGNNRFVGVGGRTVFISADGLNWAKQQIAGRCWLQSVACGDGLFVAVGWQGGDCAILTSSDGASWTRREPATRTFATATLLHVARARDASQK